MKKLAVLIVCAAVMASCDSFSGGSKNQLKAENDSLLMELTQRNAEDVYKRQTKYTNVFLFYLLIIVFPKHTPTTVLAPNCIHLRFIWIKLWPGVVMSSTKITSFPLMYSG